MRLTQVLPEVRTNTEDRGGRGMSALFRSRRDQRVKLANEFGQAFSGHAPDALYQNLSVFMGKDVPLANDRPPRDFRVGFFEAGRDASGSFPNHVKLPLHSITKDLVRREARVKRPLEKLHDFPGGLPHIPEVGCIS